MSANCGMAVSADLFSLHRKDCTLHRGPLSAVLQSTDQSVCRTPRLSVTTSGFFLGRTVDARTELKSTDVLCMKPNSLPSGASRKTVQWTSGLSLSRPQAQ